MKKTMLIVEDEPGIQLSLRDEFDSQGYEIFVASDGASGLNLALQKNPDIIILDIKLPRLDGYEICRRLRQEGCKTPVIMLTVKDQEIDKVLGLELGADDYVTKPFSLRELSARVKAVLRRAEARGTGLAEYKFGHVIINFKKYEASRNGKKIDLTPLEFDILRVLIEKKGQVLTRDDILDIIWGKDNLCVSARTVDSHIANIRKKIEEKPSAPEHILSTRGVGYKFVD